MLSGTCDRPRHRWIHGTSNWLALDVLVHCHHGKKIMTKATLPCAEYIQTAVSIIVSHFTLRETYAPALLGKKAARLRKETGDPNYRSKFDKGLTPAQFFKLAIIRPTKMLVTSPIVAILAIDMSIIYSYLYFLFTTFTFVFKEQYGFNAGEAGLAYLGLGVGFVIGQFGVGSAADKYYKRKAAQGPSKPEHRLPPLIVGAFLIPIGLIWYGWTAQFKVHWIAPIIGTSFIGFGTMCTFLPIQMYLIDTFGSHFQIARGITTCPLQEIVLSCWACKRKF